MTLQAILTQIALGEDSKRQFKVDVRNAESLAAEMVAFSNSAGGTLYIGVADDGTMSGLTATDVARINQLSAIPQANWCAAPSRYKPRTLPWKMVVSS